MCDPCGIDPAPVTPGLQCTDFSKLCATICTIEYQANRQNQHIHGFRKVRRSGLQFGEMSHDCTNSCSKMQPRRLSLQSNLNKNSLKQKNGYEADTVHISNGTSSPKTGLPIFLRPKFITFAGDRECICSHRSNHERDKAAMRISYLALDGFLSVQH